MDIDADKLIDQALREGLRNAITQKFTNTYNNPLDKLIDAAIQRHAAAFQALLSEGLQACLQDQQFRRTVAESVREKLARTLVQRFGGELEKQINVLKSDPATRARITLAIEDIVKEKTTA